MVCFLLFGGLLGLIGVGINYYTDYQSRIETAIGKGNYEKARKLASKIDSPYKRAESYERVAIAHYTYLIDTNSEDIAYRIAQEDGFTHIFFEIYVPKISEIYQKGAKDNILLWLSRVKFKNVPNLSAGSSFSYYNEEVSVYNATLEQFISYLCVVNDDTAFARKVVEFIKPTIENYGKNDERRYNYNAQKEIKSKYKLN